MVPSGRGLNGRCHHWRVRIFDWGGGGLNHMNDAIKQFRNEKLFTGQSYRKMDDKKPWPSLARNQNFC